MTGNVMLAFGLPASLIKQVIRGLMNPRKEKKTVHTIILFFQPVFNYVLVLINQLHYLHAMFRVFITSKILWLAILFRFSRMDTLWAHPYNSRLLKLFTFQNFHDVLRQLLCG